MGRVSKATRSRRQNLGLINQERRARKQLLKKQAAELQNSRELQYNLKIGVNDASSSGRENGDTVYVTNFEHAKVKEEVQEIQEGDASELDVHDNDIINEPESGNTALLLETSATDESHCLLCYRNVGNSVKPAFALAGVMKANFQVMFILKKMLRMPSFKLSEYLRTLGSPSDWKVVFCRDCIFFVKETLKIQEEIGRLEERLRNHQKEMEQKIQISWKKEMENPVATAANMPSFRVTRETRDFVYSRRKLKDNQRKIAEPIYSRNPTKTDSKKPSSYEIERRKKNLQTVLFPAQPPEISSYATDMDSDVDLAPKRSKTIVVSITAENPPTSSEEFSGGNGIVVVECPFEEYSSANSIVNSPSAEGYTHSSQKISMKAKLKQQRRRREGINNHLGENNDTLRKENYTCSLCPSLQTMTFGAFICHILFHAARPLKCSQCNLYFSSLKELEENPPKRIIDTTKTEVHLCCGDTLKKYSFEPSEKIWQCADFNCAEKFVLDNERDLHEQMCHGEALSVALIHACSLCSKKFRCFAEWLLHRALVHPELAALNCLFCQESFGSETKEGKEILDVRKLNAHIREKHPSSKIQRMPDTCEFCGAVFWDRSSLHVHMEKIHELSKHSSFSCTICYYRCKDKPRVLKHCAREHSVHLSNISVCDICGYTVKNTVAGSKLQFREHRFSKHNIDPDNGKTFSCNQDGCDFRTTVFRFLSKHMMKEHGAARKHICHVCGKGFLNAKHLRDHEQIHLNATRKPFQCEICGNSFAVKNYLYIHMRLSHLNRPFASTHKKRFPRQKRKQTKSMPSTSGDAQNNASNDNIKQNEGERGEDHHHNISNVTLPAFEMLPQDQHGLPVQPQLVNLNESLHGGEFQNVDTQQQQQSNYSFTLTSL